MHKPYSTQLPPYVLTSLLLLRLQSAERFQEPLKALGRLDARLSLIGFTHYSYLARRGGPSSQRGS